MYFAARPAIAPGSNSITKKDVSLCIHCKEIVRPKICYSVMNENHRFTTNALNELPTYTLVSLENSQR